MTTAYDLEDFDNLADLKRHVKELNAEIRYLREGQTNLVHLLFEVEHIRITNNCLQLDTLPKDRCKFYIQLYTEHYDNDLYRWNAKDVSHYRIQDILRTTQENIIKQIEEHASDI